MTPSLEPGRGSQSERILRLLRRNANGWVKTHAIYAECGSMGALHSRISELRKRGHTIEWRADRSYRLLTEPGGASRTFYSPGPIREDGPTPGSVSSRALSEEGRGPALVLPSSLSVPLPEPQAASDPAASSQRAPTPEASLARSTVGEQLRIGAA